MKNQLTLLQSLKIGFFAGLVAAITNTLIFLVFQGAGVISEDVMVQPGTPMTAPPVIASSLIPSLVAGIIYYLLFRYSSRPYRIFLVISLVLLVVSYSNPFLMIPNIPVSYALVLDLMHTIVAASVLYSFYRYLYLPFKTSV
jgi:hypothetical protein